MDGDVGLSQAEVKADSEDIMFIVKMYLTKTQLESIVFTVL